MDFFRRVLVLDYKPEICAPWGYASSKINKQSKYPHLIFLFGVCKGATIIIWGYADGVNFDLGVRTYQKVENRQSKIIRNGRRRWSKLFLKKFISQLPPFPKDSLIPNAYCLIVKTNFSLGYNSLRLRVMNERKILSLIVQKIRVPFMFVVYYVTVLKLKKRIILIIHSNN